VRNATETLDRVSGAGRLVRLTGSYRAAYSLTFLLSLIAHPALAQSNAEWTQYKIKCGIPASTAYNDWVAQGSPCPKSAAAASSTTPAVPALTPQQQLAMQGGFMIGQGLHQLLFGPPPTKPGSAPPDPAQEQRELAAEQLNNSGLYLLKQKNYAGAINEFQKVLAIIPNDANALHNLALARQQQKDAAVARQTSGALGQLLGNAPANTGLFGFGQLTESIVANPNASALSLVNLDSGSKLVDLRGTTKTSVDPEMLKSQLQEVLTNNSVTPVPASSQVVLPQREDEELLSTLSESGASQSQVVLPQRKDEELLSTLSEPRASQSQVVVPQDKDIELLGSPPSSENLNWNDGKASASKSSGSRLIPPGTPTQKSFSSDPPLKDAVGDRPAVTNKGGTTNAFGTTSNTSNPDLNASAPASPVAVHSAYDQLNSAANSGAAARINVRSDAAKIESNCGFDQSACANYVPVPVNKILAQTKGASAGPQIPAKMVNDPEVRMLNHYKEQAEDAHKAAAAAQATFEAEQKRDPHSNQLVMLHQQALEAEHKAGSLDNRVKFQTGEVQRKIKFTVINTGGNGVTTPQGQAGSPAGPPPNN
jgi:tetratricopeptide (TPR) repeat protein